MKKFNGDCARMNNIFERMLLCQKFDAHDFNLVFLPKSPAEHKNVVISSLHQSCGNSGSYGFIKVINYDEFPLLVFKPQHRPKSLSQSLILFRQINFFSNLVSKLIELSRLTG